MPRASKWSLPVRFLKMKFCIFHLPHAIYTSCLSVLPWFDNDNNICWRVQNMKLLLMYYFPAFCSFLSLIFQLSPQNFIHSTNSLHYFLMVRDNFSHLYKVTGKRGKLHMKIYHIIDNYQTQTQKQKIKKSLPYFQATIVKRMLLQRIHSFRCLL